MGHARRGTGHGKTSGQISDSSRHDDGAGNISVACDARPYPVASRPARRASKPRQEAGSKEPGAPRERRGAEADQGESEHVRAHGCASCAAALIRRAPQGTPCARRTRGADAGWFSLGYFSLTIQREVTRPQGRNALALEAKGDKPRASDRGQRPIPPLASGGESRPAQQRMRPAQSPRPTHLCTPPISNSITKLSDSISTAMPVAPA